MVATLTEEEIWQRKQEFDFTKLLSAYTEGGTKDHPVTRTMGTITDYFLNKKKYPIDVVGAAILLVFFELKNGRVFHGDGSYGSMGRELVTYIRIVCDRLLHGQLEDQVYKKIAESRMKELEDFIKSEIKYLTRPFWKRWFGNDQDVVINFSPVAKYFGGM